LAFFGEKVSLKLPYLITFPELVARLGSSNENASPKPIERYWSRNENEQPSSRPSCYEQWTAIQTVSNYFANERWGGSNLGKLINGSIDFVNFRLAAPLRFNLRNC